MNKRVLDFRGEPCPGPLVKTIRVLSSMKEGEVLHVLTDIEECMKSIREAVELLDVERVEVVRENGYWVIKVSV